MQDSITQLITASRAYGAHLGLELTTVSWRLFQDTKKLGALLSGADIQTRRHGQAMRWLSENWPPGLHWPDDIPRPPFGEQPLSDHVAPAPVSLEKSGVAQ